MHLLLLTVLAATALLSEAVALPADIKTATVEIEKQRLVKFPDELAEQPGADVAHGKGEKIDEAKRILEQIDKVNKALGYVKKQPQQAAQAKIPPMLDSSQYLFPKPAYQPFHEQHHQMEGSHGETILVPSIRAVRLDAAYAQEQQRSKGAADATPGAYNVPPLKQQPRHKPQDQAEQAQQQQSQKLKTQSQMQYFFRPSQVQVPAPQSANEQQQLPTHFVIPVHLYKLNKAEYLQKYAPQEYRVKGYKIVGDIDNFYGKAKQKGHKTSNGSGGSSNNNNKKNKTTAAKREKGEHRTSVPKYHLFFLPRELALNEDSTSRQKQTAPNAAPNATDLLIDTGSREEKLANRPYKIQATASTSNKNGASNNTANTQIVRKRIVPKPLRDKETTVGSVAIQQLPGGGTATAGTTIHIAPTPLANLNGIGQQAGNSNNNNNNNNNGNPNANPNFRPNTNNNNFNLFNRFGSNGNNNNNNDMNPNDNGNNSNANIIKTAFQNIFKLPFLPGGRPELVTEAPQMAAVPLEAPQKIFFNTSPLLPQSFYNPEHMYNNNNNNNNHNNNDNSNHNHNNNQDDWLNADNSNSADEDESAASDTDAEKGIFGNRLQELQTAHREAMKQGGIIIQRLKVRKGGIAIAGPGGVATAGSGGTAIVGPGGYALTHPRSLTIAGPGAKVIAIPASVDLKDALERTNLQSGTFPREGKIVATGPTVYFAPETGAMLEL